MSGTDGRALHLLVGRPGRRSHRRPRAGGLTMGTAEAPHCCDNAMTPIVYGMPSEGLIEASQRGEIQLGGCCVSDDLPMFVCERCGRTVGRLGEVWDEHFADDTRG